MLHAAADSQHLEMWQYWCEAATSKLQQQTGAMLAGSHKHHWMETRHCLKGPRTTLLLIMGCNCRTLSPLRSPHTAGHPARGPHRQ
jgi:hypothetical protein